MKPLFALLMIILVSFPSFGQEQSTNPDSSTTPKDAANTLRWAGCGITKKAFMKELAAAYEKYYGVHFILEGGGATKGIRRVADGSVDIGGSCRGKIQGEKKEMGVHMNPVAWDALVVMVHKDNPVSNITLRQLKDLYEGKITNWKQLGGEDAPIELYIREGKISGVGKTLRELIWANPDQEFKGSKTFPSSGPLEKAIETTPNAIGVSGISSAQKRNVKLLSLEGKAPTYDNIKAGHYMLYRPLYITYRPSNNPRLGEIKRFIRFAHSRQGREIIKAQGVVPYLDGMALNAKRREQWAEIRKMQMRGEE